MPSNQPHSLTDQEVYSLVAYLLAESKLIGENDEINSTTLPRIRMPNRDKFRRAVPDVISIRDQCNSAQQRDVAADVEAGAPGTVAQAARQRPEAGIADRSCCRSR